jgi:hypothetical protein
MTTFDGGLRVPGIIQKAIVAIRSILLSFTEFEREDILNSLKICFQRGTDEVDGPCHCWNDE